MKKMTRNEWIAVSVSIVVIGLLFFGGIVSDFINSSTNKQAPMPEQKQSGVVIEDTLEGRGDIATLGDTVSVHYSGALQNGKVFDSSYDRGQPITFILGAGQVIKGWEEGIRGMRVGGKRKLTISPEYGYGPQAVGPIPANSTLYFDVELMNVQHSSSTPTIKTE